LANQSTETKVHVKTESATLPDVKHSASACAFTPSGQSPSSSSSKHANVIHSPVSFSSNDMHTFDESFASHSSTASASSSPSSSRYIKERQGSEERIEQPALHQQRPNVIQMPLHRPIPIKHNTVPLPSPSSSLPQASYQPTPSPFFRPAQSASSSLANLSTLLNDYWRRIALNLPAASIPQPSTPLLPPANTNGGLWIPQSIPQIGTIPQRLNLPTGGREAAEQSLLPAFASTAFQLAQTETTSNYSNPLYAMAAALANSNNQTSVPTTSAELAAQFQAALARQTDFGLASYQRFMASEQAASAPQLGVFKHMESGSTSATPQQISSKVPNSEASTVKAEPTVNLFSIRPGSFYKKMLTVLAWPKLEIYESFMSEDST
jgi:hypothetical protein